MHTVLVLAQILVEQEDAPFASTFKFHGNDIAANCVSRTLDLLFSFRGPRANPTDAAADGLVPVEMTTSGRLFVLEQKF